MSDYIQATIDAGGLTLVTEPLGDDRYRCTVTSTMGEMVRDLRVQPDAGPPTLGQILYYYANRVQAVADTDDSLEWAEETGQNIGDPNVLATYRSIVEDLDALKRLLSPKGVDELLGGLAINQAISRAFGGR